MTTMNMRKGNNAHVSGYFLRRGMLHIYGLVTALMLTVFLGVSAGNDVSAHSIAPKSLVKYVVAQDGSGNYTTVQAAVDAVQANNTQPVVIYIKNGTYNEVVTVPSNKPLITFYGQDKNKSVISYDNYASKPKPGGGTYGTFGSATMFVEANDVTMTNRTV